MPRRPRLKIADLPQHVIHRGNNRSVCFFADEDYQFFRDQLAELAARFKVSVHAYVLMTNHIHLLMTPGFPGALSLLMKFLGQRYAQYVNRTYQRTGTIWEGRFRASLVQTERYLLECYRYIELNPVRAGMVQHPNEYRWSSYGANAQGHVVPWLTPHAEYLALGDSPESCRAAYRELFRFALDPSLLDEIRKTGHGNHALGTSRFRDEIERTLKQRVTPAPRGRPPTRPHNALQAIPQEPSR